MYGFSRFVPRHDFFILSLINQSVATASFVSYDCQKYQEVQMEKLHPNWLLEGWIDREYKEYVLLDYVNFVQKQFNRHRLYPFLNDLVQHLEQANQLKTEKAELESLFPKKLKSINWDELKLVFENDRLSSTALDEIQRYLICPSPLRNSYCGSEHYEHIERQMTLEPVGLFRWSKKVFWRPDHKEVLASLLLSEHQNDRYRSFGPHLSTLSKKPSIHWTNQAETIQLYRIYLTATWAAVFDPFSQRFYPLVNASQPLS